MYRAFLLILCLLLSATLVVAQRPGTRRPTPSPAIPALTKEQLERVRRIALEMLIHNYVEGQRSRAQGTVFTPEQLSLAQYPGIEFHIPEGLGRGLDLNLDLNIDRERINASTNAAIGAFNLLPQLVAASNQPPVPRRANNTPDLTARAAAHPGASPDPCENSRPSEPSVRCVDAAAGRLFVRSDPKGFYVGSLYPGEHFRVEAVRYIPEDRNGNLVCYFYGNAFGNVQEKGVWVNCEGLEPRAKKAPRPPRAEVNTQYHTPGPINPKDGIFSTREHLEKRFDVEILFPETLVGGNSKVLAVVKPEIGSTQLYGNYDPRKQFPFVDPLNITIYANDPPDRLKVRYVSNDGNYAVVNYDIGIDPKTGGEIRRWGVVSTQSINILRP